MSRQQLPSAPSLLWLAAALVAAGLAVLAVSSALGLPNESESARAAVAARATTASIPELARNASADDGAVLESALANLASHIGTLVAGKSGGGSELGATAYDELGAAVAQLELAARAVRDDDINEGAVTQAAAAVATAIDVVETIRPSTVDIMNERRLLLVGAALFALLSAGILTTMALVLVQRLDLTYRLAAAASRRLDGVTADLVYMVYETDEKGYIRWVTPSCEDLLGWKPAELLGRRVRDFVAYGAEPIPNQLEVRAGGIETSEYHWRHRNGSTYALEVMVHPLGDRGSRAMRCVVRETGDELAAQRALRENQRAFVEMLQAAQNGFVIASTDGDVLLFNVALSEMLGYPPDELQALTVLDFFPPDDAAEVLKLARARVESEEAGSARYEGRARRRDRALRDVEMSISPYRLGHEVQSVLIEINDITERNRATERIQQMANFDQLTGLPNRYRLNADVSEVLTAAARHGETRALMVVDLDRFKLVNDSLGHSAGDDLLRQVAARLAGAISDAHTLGRLGGDEFLLLSPPIRNLDDAASTAKTIVGALSTPFTVQRRQVHVDASIGISLFPNDGHDAATLIQHADSAMYRAKEVGGSGYQFASSAIMDALHGKLTLETELRGAIDRGEFVVFYQPEVDAVTGRIRGMEALLRWNHPQQGLIPPSVIIPLLEEGGMIGQVGDWVLRTACEEAQSWQRAGHLPTMISVNLSPKQLANPSLLQTVRSVLSETGLDPHLLELEVTESAALTDLDGGIRALRELHELGVRTAIDDFGTGHSSLVRLKELPVTALKIDRSFVAGMTEHDDDASIVGGVVALGQALGLTVIAEGVESDRQRRALQALGCDVLQGFLFAQPVPSSRTHELLAEDRAAA